MAAVYQVLVIFGSLGVFLYGMRLMSDGLQKVAGSRLKSILGYMTTNRFAGVASGFLITTLIQSSSATTVMVVGFVDAALLTLRQAIGVIMGANIGTTVTGWIVALFGFKFSISAAALPAIAIGTLMMIIKKIDQDEIAEILIGFGLLFLGLGLLKDSVPDIRNNPQILAFLRGYTSFGFGSFLIFIGVGALLTFIVQSSSAAMTITLTMTFSGWIDYPTAAAIVLGENIGTTITANIAALHAGENAKLAARVHTIFNLIGILWMAPLFQPFLSLVDIIVPGSVTGRVEITAHLAMFHTLFNITNTILFIGFTKRIAQVVGLTRRKHPSTSEKYRFAYVRAGMQDTIELNLLKAQAEIVKLAEQVEKLFNAFRMLFKNPAQKFRKVQREADSLRELTVDMQDQIAEYLVECSREAISEKLAKNINYLVRIVTELESTADTCNKLIYLAVKRAEKDVKLDKDLAEAIAPYADAVVQFLEYNRVHLKDRLTEPEFDQAKMMEDQINKYQKKLKREAQRRIRKGSNVKQELFYIDVLKHIEHIGDFSLAVSQSLTKIR